MTYTTFKVVKTALIFFFIYIKLRASVEIDLPQTEYMPWPAYGLKPPWLLVKAHLSMLLLPDLTGCSSLADYQYLCDKLLASGNPKQRIPMDLDLEI